MGKTITIRCKNTGRSHKIPIGFTLEEVYEMLEIKMPFEPTSAKVNNKVEGLHFMFFNDKDVEFLDVTSPSGLRTYTRSLFFVLYKAVRDLYPGARLRIDTPVSNGYFCQLETEGGVTPAVVGALKKRMDEIVAEDLSFHRITCPTDEAVARFRADGLESKARLLESCGSLYTTYYTLGDTADYFYGSLLIKTSQLILFDLVAYGDGLLLRLPDPKNPHHLMPMTDQPKMFEVFREQHHWQHILGISTIGEFNVACNEVHLLRFRVVRKQVAVEEPIHHLPHRTHLRGVLVGEIVVPLASQGCLGRQKGQEHRQREGEWGKYAFHRLGVVTLGWWEKGRRFCEQRRQRRSLAKAERRNCCRETTILPSVARVFPRRGRGGLSGFSRPHPIGKTSCQCLRE